MKRLVIACAILTAVGCSNREPSNHAKAGALATIPATAGTTKPAATPVTRTPPPAPTAMVVPATPAPVAGPPVAPPVAPTTSGPGGAAGQRARPLSVVIMMLPDLNDDPAHPAARTYKLSLTADTETATIEVDGTPVGTARVQKVYPREGRPDRGRYAVRVSADGAIDGEPAPAGQTPDALDAAARGTRRPPARLSVAAHQPNLNPNGAPIID